MIQRAYLGLNRHKSLDVHSSLNHYYYGIFAPLALITFAGCWQFLLSTHFTPLTEGWFTAYAEMSMSGSQRYLDYDLYLPPVYPILIQIFTQVFGQSFLALRVLGAAINAGIVLGLYCLLRVEYSIQGSFFGAFVGYVYYTLNNAYISYDFTQLLSLCAVGVMASILGIVQSHEESRRFGAARVMWAGALTSVTVLVKQSNGAFLAIGVASGLIVRAVWQRKIHWEQWLAFSLGVAFPVIATIAYLVWAGAFESFLNAVVVNALASKGGSSGIFKGISEINIQNFGMEVLIIGSAIITLSPANILVQYVVVWILERDQDVLQFDLAYSLRKVVDISPTAAVFATGAVIPWLAWSGSETGRTPAVRWGLELIQVFIPWALGFSILGVGIAIVLSTAGVMYKRMSANAGFCVLSLSWLIGNAASAGFSELGAFPAVAWGMAILASNRYMRPIGPILVVIASLLVTSAVTFSKVDVPYAWWGVEVPSVRVSTQPLVGGPWGGLWSEPKLARTYERLARVLRESPGSSIASYPNIPVAYLLSGRLPGGRVVVPWFDVLSDVGAVREANRLLVDAPDTIVLLEMPDTVIASHERLFRSGHSSGQRSLHQVLYEYCFSKRRYNIVLEEDVPVANKLFVCENTGVN